MIIDALDVGKPFVYTLIHHIPEDYWDEEIFQSDFEHLGIYSSGISNVPEHKLTYEMCLSNVKYTAYAILEVPERYQTAEIYREAARSLGNLGYPRDWKIIERIPSIWKTDDFYSEARKPLNNRLYPVSTQCLNRHLRLVKVISAQSSHYVSVFLLRFPKKGRLPLYQVVESFRPAMASAYRFAQANMAYSRFSFFLSPRYTVFL